VLRIESEVAKIHVFGQNNRVCDFNDFNRKTPSITRQLLLRGVLYKFAARKFGSWKRIISFPISVSARVRVLYIFRYAEIGNGHCIIEPRIYRHISFPSFL
jgi:hypothetical protein